MAEPGLAAARWVEPPPVSEESVARLSRRLDLPAELSRILVLRGVTDPESARSFLRPHLSALPTPGDLPDLTAAAWRLEAALAAGEQILVHGDYDADGLCSTALLTRGLAGLGARVTAFVPHRTRDGYDLSEPGLRRAEEVGARLIVTADCGIVAHAAVEQATAAGVDVIITDHHRPGVELPRAIAVVNPNRRDSAYPFRELAGVGVAFQLLAALYRRAGRVEGELNQHLDLVAIGTVADQTPLLGDNRILVRAGLRALARTRKPGLRALLERCGISEPTTRHVGFVLAPRLNSVGRMGSAEEGLRLLLTEDAEEARRLASVLERENVRRRSEDRAVTASALEAVERGFDGSPGPVAVVWGEGWHPGVLGIVASRLVERLHRPAVVVGFDGQVGRGSGRSCGGFHLLRALRQCGDLLERYGGHRMAAGFTVRRERVEALADRLRAVAARELDEDSRIPRLELELEVPLSAATPELHRWLSHLAPFGEANPEPLLLTRRVRVESARAVGPEGKHLRAVLVSEGGARLPAIGFGLGPRIGEAIGGARDVAFELAADRWRGTARYQARVRDFRPAL